MAAAFLEFTEGVQKARFDEGTEASPFLRGKAVVASVGFGMGEVQFGVSDIEVATKDCGFLARKPFEVAKEFAVPLLPVREAGEFALGVGNVNIDEEEIGIFGGEHAAFAVVFGAADAG